MGGDEALCTKGGGGGGNGEEEVVVVVAAVIEEEVEEYEEEDSLRQRISNVCLSLNLSIDDGQRSNCALEGRSSWSRQAEQPIVTEPRRLAYW